ncbi:MAG: glycoside hydrolase family 2 protein [Bacteroidaceae bacterium]|nr:glycoside hydrolase family 2 protein [Bacteroides sp.]MBQ4589469.1 glycoside hydrolase family 2 protein [Bacteroidaceae bacterium]
MKKGILIMLLGVLPMLLSATGYREPEKISLNKGWEFSQVGKGEWLPATVPGTVHQDLIDNDKLVNPFYGLNEEKVQWVEKEDWQYRTTFIVTKEQLARQAAVLKFEGLDTYADIYLNGSLLERTDNMFVGYELLVKEVLREGENRLQVYFHSPIKQAMPQWETDGFDYPADNDHSKIRVSIYSRKAPYSFGWDWGIRLATSGIWRPVTLEFYDAASIEDFYVHQESVNKELAKVNNVLEVKSVATTPQQAEVTLTYSYKDEPKVKEQKNVTLQPGCNEISLPIEIVNPHLWMPNGWGEAALYDFELSVKVDGRVVASEKKRIGLRTVKVVLEDDKDGKAFYFVVNGQPMFAKGSNFIPNDALLPNVTAERYYQLMKDVKDAHHNMIRVWGGGIYEDNRFYEAADEMGILVWQDFIFACTTYPSDPNFLRRVAEEAEYNIKRLRNHASLAMWCGNNEIYEGMRFWGWKRRYKNPVIWEEMQEGYNKLFHQLLPDMVKKYDGDRFYMHGSPYEANWGRPNTWKIADSHNWGTWYGRKPFESLDKELSRFMSEFGFQSFPEMKTLATFAEPKDYALESEVMNAHQKASIGNALIKKTMALYYDVPEDFEELVYKGLVLQGYGIRHGIEAHRRNRPYCMGSLYWQLNDSWPVVSWSSIDYYGNWKAMHYQGKRAFAPVLLNVFQEGDDLCFYTLSDELKDYKDATLQWKLMDFNGKVLNKKTVKGEVPANVSAVFHKETYSDWATDPTRTLLLVTLKDRQGKVLSEVIHYFSFPKDQELPDAKVSYKIKTFDGKCEVTLSAKQLARDIFVEIPVQGAKFTDNFFDLLPGQTKKITITSDKIKKAEPVALKIRHLKCLIK